MHLNPTLRAGFALLLVVMMSLRGAGASAGCTALDPAHLGTDGSAAAHASEQHCTQGVTRVYRHGCGECCEKCCAAAVALTAVHWNPPHTGAADVSAALEWPPPSYPIDRLDRPPRTLRA